MARLVADKHTEAVVRQANARRVAEAPLLAYAGLVEQETVEDRLALRRRLAEGTFWRFNIHQAASEAAAVNRARWYAYLCSLHPAALPGLLERLMDSTNGPPSFLLWRARRTYAKLIEGISIVDDFEANPAPYFWICRKHWLRLEVPPEQRKADMEAEIAAWKAAHPDETTAWEQRRRSRVDAEAKCEVVYHDGKYAA